MKLRATLTLGIASLALYAQAEPRWCVVSGKDPSNTLVYPPIARAARVQGIVVMRMIYVPNGNVLRTEPVFGPRLLSDTLTGQLMGWTLKTDAKGDELCETLVIAEFKLKQAGTLLPEPLVRPEPGSVLRLSVETEPILLDEVISDPAPLRGFKLLRAEVKWKLRRAFRWLFNAHATSQ